MTPEELKALATDWRKATPADRSPSYILDDLCPHVLRLLDEVEALSTSRARLLEFETLYHSAVSEADSLAFQLKEEQRLGEARLQHQMDKSREIERLKRQLDSAVSQVERMKLTAEEDDAVWTLREHLRMALELPTAIHREWKERSLKVLDRLLDAALEAKP